MGGSGMARRCQQALSAAVAGACLTLSACGAAAAPLAGPATASASATTGSARSTSARLTGHFCRDATTFMRHIPATAATKHTSAAQARANLRTALRATVKGFTALKAEAPAKLHKPLKTIVGVYKSDEKVLNASGNTTQVNESMVKGNASGSRAFQRVVRYISVNCK
jgi:hypothetical protein